jgi:hypothetical protein
MNRNNLSLLDIAWIGLYLDDPYGDGIRLQRVREPSDGRLAAIDLVYNAQHSIGADILIRAEYEERVMAPKYWKRNGELAPWLEARIGQNGNL